MYSDQQLASRAQHSDHLTLSAPLKFVQKTCAPPELGEEPEEEEDEDEEEEAKEEVVEEEEEKGQDDRVELYCCWPDQQVPTRPPTRQ